MRGSIPPKATMHRQIRKRQERKTERMKQISTFYGGSSEGGGVSWKGMEVEEQEQGDDMVSFLKRKST